MENIKIRDDIEMHMKELKDWLEEIRDCPPEEMGAFFTARLEGYEEHMAIWKPAYERFARLLPENCREILDLGCGTGLELDEIWKLRGDVNVTGVDLNEEMLEVLAEAHVDVEYMYSLFTNKDGHAYMVLRISDEPKFLSALGEHRIKVMSKEDLGLR